ncbi:MAG: PrsW family intramembrane metalloprotease [Ignavibacteria bacterium]|jgi:RsiW-degrading membrane proteinase PrsW (M82 family)
MVIASLIAAIIPMVTYLFIIWKMDKYEPEPFKIVLKHFLYGAFGSIILALVGSSILSMQLGLFVKNPAQLSLYETILVAPFIEEITKGIYLFGTSRKKVFDNLTDGLVYGGAIGLGFGMTENFIYFITFPETITQWIGLVIIRSSFSAVMHCIATATVGAFLGLAKFSVKENKSLLTFFGFIIAMFLHFSWNFTVSFDTTYYFGFLALFVIIIFFILLFNYSLKTEQKIIIKELSEENIPKDHINIIASSLSRLKGWVDEGVRKRYIYAAIKLAFRKVEFRNSPVQLKPFYASEVIKYRIQLEQIISTFKK